ncbi:aminodeoxychorismate synthase, component I [Alkalicoccus chagannorensis]|uniref:aminodeoxychorismate synthase, component I n=1 Tax=Alkalicoccus chagannorensis TaxID=427072 RepID=UPI00042A1343|nr:aminodeoxychorismate synthase, component I [Alkalicoccus chagannorensis]
MRHINAVSAAAEPLQGEAWFDRYETLAADEQYHILMESGRGGRYSFIGLRPFAVLTGKDGRLTVEEDRETKVHHGPLLETLRTWLARFDLPHRPDLPDFQGGLAGQFSYDLIRSIEKIPEAAADDLAAEDLLLLAFDEIVVIDHQKDLRWIIALGEDDREAAAKRERMAERWESAAGSTPDYARVEADDETVRSFSEEAFAEAVERTKQYIADGDVFQVNLSVRESRRQTTPPLHMYRCLREVNPSPYMGMMHTPEKQYVSASPELLVKKAGSDVSTRPIAGTRSRGRDETEDQALAETLLYNEKERAEHIMLVDLERNDLGRVCEYGTVEVDELMVIEKYSHVQHIVSNVRGRCAPQHDAVDVIAAAFPGGTITGAPKIRTMEIIEELEPVRRGAYTGSMGWIGFNGDMELNITIRTMVVQDGWIHVQAGAGIVIDSQPRAEFKEALKKARALWTAKEQSEAELYEQRRMKQ